MKTRFFKFPDMETSFQLAHQVGLTSLNEAGEEMLVRFTHQYAIDVVGIMYEPSGEVITNEDGFESPVMVAIPGWHVNVRVINEAENPIPDAFLEYEVFPATPARDFA